MKKIFLRFGLIIFASGLVLIFTSPVTHSNKVPSNNFNDSEIEGYKQWTRVNPKPVKLDAPMSVMCAPASAARVNNSPHTNKFITVYVNNLGKVMMMQAMNPQFPQGTIIV